MVDADELRAWDLAHVWHPYTQMEEYAQDEPVVIERAEGCRLFDTQGRAYWDGVSSIWLNVHGHRVQEIDEAVRRQLDQVAHTTLLGQANVPSIELAHRLAAQSPGDLDRVFYSDNGSTAVEAALKMALQYWHLQGRAEKTGILGLEGAYHGDTLGCVGVARVPAFHAPFEAALPPGHAPLPFPDTYRGQGTAAEVRDQALQEAAARLEAEADTLAAVIVEPMVQGVGGIRVMPEGYLAGLRGLCDRHDVLLIADEVATGFGRTGELFACGHEGVVPDLMALGKGITGGYLPLAATLAREHVHDAFLGAYRDRTFFHGHSYTGNQLGCAAALASLDLLLPRLPAVRENAQWVAARMARFCDHPFVGDVRGLGLMRGVELVADKEAKQPFPAEARAGWHVYKAARARGLLARPYANVGIFMPPLAATRQELAAMLDIYEQALEDAKPALARHKAVAA